MNALKNQIIADVETPWGAPDNIEHVADGITWYDTPSHGGYHLSDERLAQLPPICRDTRAGSGWFEEDCDAAIVHLFFADEVGATETESATRILRAGLGKNHRQQLSAIQAHKGGGMDESVSLTDLFDMGPKS